MLSDVTESQRHSMIIYIKHTDINYPYNDLVKVNFNVEDIILTNDKEIERSRSLSLQIQYMFEERLVKVLEMMSDFNAELIPRRQEDGEILQDAVRTKLVRSLKDKYVVQDLSPDSKTGKLLEIISSNVKTLFWNVYINGVNYAGPSLPYWGLGPGALKLGNFVLF